MEKLDEIIRQNLHGSSYLSVYENLPHYLKSVIAESAHELYNQKHIVVDSSDDITKKC